MFFDYIYINIPRDAWGDLYDIHGSLLLDREVLGGSSLSKLGAKPWKYFCLVHHEKAFSAPASDAFDSVSGLTLLSKARFHAWAAGYSRKHSARGSQGVLAGKCFGQFGRSA